jgi:hypothetical protein
MTSFCKIDLNASRQEVESILGGPPRIETDHIYFYGRSGVWRAEEWWGEEGAIFVEYEYPFIARSEWPG